MKIDSRQIRRIYAIGAASGIVERGNKDDDLHALVYQMTGKTSVSSLTAAEGDAVERELKSKCGQASPTKKTYREASGVPGMMTKAQQSLAWRMIYRLQELDTKPESATPGERMCGAIKKILGVDASVQSPMRWIDAEGGEKLIEQLKRYVRSAERRASKAKPVESG